MKLLLLLALLPVSAAAQVTLSAGTCTGTALSNTQYQAFAGCTLSASGGTGPYTYSAISNNSSYASLVEGLSVNSSTGAISGSDILGQGHYGVLMQACDVTSTCGTLLVNFEIAGHNVWTGTGCTPFAYDTVWNQRHDLLPASTSPADTPIATAIQSLHVAVEFGDTAAGNVPDGIPFIFVPSGQTFVTISGSETGYFTSAPIPLTAPVEGTASSPGDKHVSVVQEGSNCTLWELWESVQSGGGWTEQGQALYTTINLDSSPMLPQDNANADAAGMPIGTQLVTANEVNGTGTKTSPNGSLNHVIRATFPQGSLLNRHESPGTGQAAYGACSGGYLNGGDDNKLILQGTGEPTSCTSTLPSGAILRLKASATDPGCLASSPQSAIIVQGLRKYGISQADNGGSFIGLIGTPDSNWNDSDLNCLTNYVGSDFEVVDLSSTWADLTTNYMSSGYSAPVTTYRILEPSLVSITITPTTASIPSTSGTQQYTPVCTYSDTSTDDCTQAGGVTWASSATGVATINSSGLASATSGHGATDITAANGAITSNTAVLTVFVAPGESVFGLWWTGLTVVH